MSDGRWNPWRALREREHVRLAWTRLRGTRGLWESHGDGRVTIHLDPRLSRRERRCVLAHELVHDERQIGYGPWTPAALIEVEERCVWAETVDRLVPPGQLAALVDQGMPLMLWELCDHFDIDHQTAKLAVARDKRSAT